MDKETVQHCALTQSRPRSTRSALVDLVFIQIQQNYSQAIIPKLFSYFLTKTYVVGTQKNRLNEYPKHR